MQIVIDINEHLYKMIKTLGLVVEDGDAVVVSEAIKNAIPLDDVKAEIEANMYCDKDTRLVKNANASGLKEALEILDNVGKAESEDKE